MVHAYTPHAIQTAIHAEREVHRSRRRKLIDGSHRQSLMAEKGIWLSLQPFLDDQDANPFSRRLG